MLNTMLNGLSLAILTHTFVFKSTPGAGFGWVSLEPFGCYFGIQCSVKPITIKISDRVGCLCAILSAVCEAFRRYAPKFSPTQILKLKYYWLFAPIWQPINLKCHWGWNLGPSANGGFINRGGQFLTSG